MILVALDLVAITADSGSPPRAARDSSSAILTLETSARESLVRGSGIPFARRVGGEASLAAHVARVALDAAGETSNRSAVVLVGGQGHVASALDFAERALRVGAAMVDPMRFPSVLPSFTPTAVAAVIGAHGPALTVGHDEAAYGDALGAAAALLSYGFADAAFVIAVADDPPWRDTETEPVPRPACAVAAYLKPPDAREAARVAARGPAAFPEAARFRVAGHAAPALAHWAVAHGGIGEPAG